MKTLFYSLVTAIFLASIPCHLPATIVETDEISSIIREADSQTLVLFNISNTLYTSYNTMGDALWKNFFSKRVHKVIHDSGTADRIINSMKNAIVNSVPKKLVDPEIRNLISHLQSYQIPVLGLTLKYLSRPYADNFGEITANHLLLLGIDFEVTNSYLKMTPPYGDDEHQKYAYGIIFTEGAKPGLAIKHFLKRAKHHSINQVIVIDDREENLKEAEKTLAYTGIVFKGFRYGRCDFRKQSFDETLGIIQFLKFLETKEIISDEEAKSIKECTSFIQYEDLLDKAILKLADSPILTE